MNSKLLILALFVLLSAPSSEAVMMFCGKAAALGDPNSDIHDLSHEVVEGDRSASVKCEMIDLVMQKGKFKSVTNRVRMSIVGVGPGLRMNVFNGFVIHCPLVMSLKGLLRHDFKGVKASAGLGPTATVAVFANKRLGACVLAGAGIGAGFGVTGAKLSFSIDESTHDDPTAELELEESQGTR
jgi:hypothetical protein